MKQRQGILSLLAISSVLLAQPALHAQDDPHGRIAVQRNSGLEPCGPSVLRGGGADYDVRFDANGVTFEPALGSVAPTTQHLHLRAQSVRRGGEDVVVPDGRVAPTQEHRTAIYEHAAGVRERFRCGVDALELSWVFDRRPEGSGDLVVRYAIDTSLPAAVATDDGGVQFATAMYGGVSVGTVTGVDADGRNVPGQLRVEGDVLELSLPHAFVEDASYPLVLDPAIAPAFTINGGPQYDYSDPDCAFERSEMRYMVTFVRTFSALDVRGRAQIVEDDGTLFQGVIWTSTNGALSTRPRIAGFYRHELCGIVYTEQVGAMQVAFFRTVSIHGGPGAAGAPITIGLSTAGTIVDLDIGAEAGSYDETPAFVAVWHDTNDASIFARRINLHSDSSGGVEGTPFLGPGFTVFSDAGLFSYSEPQIARGASSEGKLMMVAKRYSGFGPVEAVVGALLDARADTVENVTTIHSGGLGATVDSPDVDGYGNNWVVAWRETTSGSSFSRVGSRSVAFDGASLTLGAVATIGGYASGQADHPTVGYSTGKTWIGHHWSSFGFEYLRATGVDSTTCLSCADLVSNLIVSNHRRVVVTTAMSGHVTWNADSAMIWEENGDVWMQLLAQYTTSGTVVDLGGGCGDSGQHAGWPSAPGMNIVSANVTGLPPTALLTVFNFSINQSPLGCGLCEWVPFEFTILATPSPGGSASVSWSVPCRQDLVGAQFVTQWTTWNPGDAPCAVFPDWVVSNRLLHTIGN